MQDSCHVLLGMTMSLCTPHKAPRAQLPHSSALPSLMNRSYCISSLTEKKRGGSSNCVPPRPIAFKRERPHRGPETRTHRLYPRSGSVLGSVGRVPASLAFPTASLPGGSHSRHASVSRWNLWYCPIQLNAPSSCVPRSQRWVLAIKQSHVLEL